ncbi:MAG: phosphate ABC transporter substrate-binding/OmpA family protein [Pseudomonadota bacterium]
MKLGRAARLAALFICGLVPMAAAQDVTLTSRDGAVEVSGTLLGFDGEFYRVETIYGELTVDGSGVTCEGPACPNLQDFIAELAISGSAAMGSVLVPALLEGFALRYGYGVERAAIDPSRFVITLTDQATGKPRAVFTFRASNTDEGFADLLVNEADIVMALREIRPDERQRAREAGMGDMTGANRSRVIALDALVPIVAPGNPVTQLAPTELARIMAGEITNWQEVGGVDAPIAVHLPALDGGLGQAAFDLLMSPAKRRFAGGVTEHARGVELTEAVLADPFAIGLSSYAEVGRAVALPLTGACGFTLRAGRRTIKTEDYPLTTPMFLYTPARRLPKIAREFLAFTRSQAAQIVIRRAGFVDQAPEEVPIDLQGDRFANALSSAGPEITLQELQRMTRTLRGMSRLTTSFRFETGSARLDAQSRSNVQQMARALETGRYDARRILLAGFSDGEGAAGANRDIALRRAEAVRRAIIAAAETANLDRVQIDVDAYGEAMPMACDDSAWGRQANRRVEVWVR